MVDQDSEPSLPGHSLGHYCHRHRHLHRGDRGPQKPLLLQERDRSKNISGLGGTFNRLPRLTPEINWTRLLNARRVCRLQPLSKVTETSKHDPVTCHPPGTPSLAILPSIEVPLCVSPRRVPQADPQCQCQESPGFWTVCPIMGGSTEVTKEAGLAPLSLHRPPQSERTK